MHFENFMKFLFLGSCLRCRLEWNCSSGGYFEEQSPKNRGKNDKVACLYIE